MGAPQSAADAADMKACKSLASRKAYARGARGMTAGMGEEPYMENELELTKKRLTELSRRAFERGIQTSSDFLSPGEQAEAARLRLPEPAVFEGGYPEAERRVAVFGGGEAPVICLEIAPTAPKFAGELTPRDYLGSLMDLGLRRGLLGDIILAEGRAYAFCLEAAARIIERELNQVRRAAVRVTRAEALPEGLASPPEESVVAAASERLDALVAAAFRLSRAESARLFEAERVFVNGLPARSSSAKPEPGDIVSVRGMGRFRFEGALGETRRGRLRVSLRIYGR